MGKKVVIIFSLFIVFIGFIFIMAQVDTFSDKISFKQSDKIYFITQSDMNMMNDNLHFLGKESAFCIYSNDGKTLEIDKADITSNSIHYINYYCNTLRNDYMGSIHTHSFSYFDSSLSSQDGFDFGITGNKLLGVMYAKDKIAFYENINDKLYLVDYEVF